MVTVVSVSALISSAGMLSGPAAFPFLSVAMAFLTSALDGLLQLMGSSVSADGHGMSGSASGAGWFNNSLKCYAHLFSCSSVVVSGLPSLFLTGLSVCVLELAWQLLGCQV